MWYAKTGSTVASAGRTSVFDRCVRAIEFAGGTVVNVDIRTVDYNWCGYTVEGHGRLLSPYVGFVAEEDARETPIVRPLKTDK